MFICATTCRHSPRSEHNAAMYQSTSPSSFCIAEMSRDLLWPIHFFTRSTTSPASPATPRARMARRRSLLSAPPSSVRRAAVWESAGRVACASWLHLHGGRVIGFFDGLDRAEMYLDVLTRWRVGEHYRHTAILRRERRLGPVRGDLNEDPSPPVGRSPVFLEHEGTTLVLEEAVGDLAPFVVLARERHDGLEHGELREEVLGEEGARVGRARARVAFLVEHVEEP